MAPRDRRSVLWFLAGATRLRTNQNQASCHTRTPAQAGSPEADGRYSCSMAQCGTSTCSCNRVECVSRSLNKGPHGAKRSPHGFTVPSRHRPREPTRTKRLFVLVLLLRPDRRRRTAGTRARWPNAGPAPALGTRVGCVSRSLNKGPHGAG